MSNELYTETIYIYLLQIQMFGKSTIYSEINKVNRNQIEGWSNAGLGQIKTACIHLS